MSTETLKSTIAKLAQRRYILEKSCQRIGKMLATSLILRAFPHKGDDSYASAQGKAYPRYAFLTYYDGITTRHKYVPKAKIDELIPLAGNYQRFRKWMKEIRSLNRHIIELLEEIKELQTQPIPQDILKKKRGGKIERAAEKGPVQKRLPGKRPKEKRRKAKE